MTDLVITLAIAILTAALIPTVINQFRAKASSMPLTTSIPSLVALTLFLGAYIYQGWWFSAGITIFNYGLWTVIMFQRWAYKPRLICNCALFRDWDNKEDAVYDDLENDNSNAFRLWCPRCKQSWDIRAIEDIDVFICPLCGKNQP